MDEPTLKDYYELKQDLTDKTAKMDKELARVALLAQQAMDKASSADSTLRKAGGVVLTAVAIAVLKQTGVI